MQPLRIGLELAGLRQPFKQALHTAAPWEVEAVEIDGRNAAFAVELSHSGPWRLRKVPDDLNVVVTVPSDLSQHQGYFTVADRDTADPVTADPQAIFDRRKLV